MTATADARNVMGEATLGELEAALRGALVQPDDTDLDPGPRHKTPPGAERPALVVRSAGHRSIVGGESPAKAPMAIRGGAHSIAGFSTSDGGVVAGAPSRCRASMWTRPAGGPSPSPGSPLSVRPRDPGVRAGACTGSLVSSTGIAGFTLGGGIGWLLASIGLTCDDLLLADVARATAEPSPPARTSTPVGPCAAAVATSAS